MTPQFLSAPVSPKPLGLFRIVFAASCLYWVYEELKLVDYIYRPGAFQFYITPMDLWSFLPAGGMRVVLLGMAVAACGILLGVFYRLSSSAFFLFYLYYFLGNQTTALNNHYYLLALLAFIMVLVPADSYASLARSRHRDAIPRWPLVLLRGQIIVVYLYGGIRKIGSDWLLGQPVEQWLTNAFPDGSALEKIFSTPAMEATFVYGGIGIDILIGVLLISCRTRLLAVFLLVPFHLINSYLFVIGVFPKFMIAATILFLNDKEIQSGASFKPSRLAPGFVYVYLLLQLLFPLRAYVVSENSLWTGQGDRFSWNMKLFRRDGYVTFWAQQPGESIREKIDLCEDLSSLQITLLSTRPEMMRDYAVHLAERALKLGKEAPVVTVDAYASLNGRLFQRYIDAEINLATASVPMFSRAPWILPLEANVPIGLYPSPPAGEQTLIICENDDFFRETLLPMWAQGHGARAY